MGEDEADRGRREEQAIARVTSTLVENFAGAHPADRVERTVDTARARFAGHPVREFVPILIERIVRRELGASAGEVPAAERVAVEPGPAQAPAGTTPRSAEATSVMQDVPRTAAVVPEAADDDSADRRDGTVAGEAGQVPDADETSGAQGATASRTGTDGAATDNGRVTGAHPGADSSPASGPHRSPTLPATGALATPAATGDSTATAPGDGGPGDRALTTPSDRGARPATAGSATDPANDTEPAVTSGDITQPAQSHDAAAVPAHGVTRRANGGSAPAPSSGAAQPADGDNAPVIAPGDAAQRANGDDAATHLAKEDGTPAAAQGAGEFPTPTSPDDAPYGRHALRETITQEDANEHWTFLAVARKWTIERPLVPLVIGLVLVLAVVGGVVANRPGDAPQPVAASAPVTVRGLVGSEKVEFFGDPRVAEVFARHGLEVAVEPAGSRRIASLDLAGYEFVFPSSATAADRIRRDRAVAATYTPFSSPMAVATFAPIVEALTAAGVMRPGPVPTLDVAKYLELVRDNVEWQRLPGNTAYPVGKNVLMSTTDPRTSNSAAMYLAVAGFVANDNAVVAGADAERKVLPLLSRLFAGQGRTEDTSEGPFREYLSVGMGPAPLVWIYEQQFVEAVVAGRTRPGMVLAYPSPTVVSQHTLVPLGDAGDRIGRLLTSDPELQRLAAEHGFRTGDPARFAAVTAEHRVPVAGTVIDVVDTPTSETLERLIDGVAAAYR